MSAQGTFRVPAPPGSTRNGRTRPDRFTRQQDHQVGSARAPRAAGVNGMTGPGARIVAPGDVPAVDPRPPCGRAEREDLETTLLAPGCHRGPRAPPADRATARGTGPLADMLRARPGPHPPQGNCVSTPGGQDAGLRLPRGPPAHPADPRPRGCPGRHCIARALPPQRGARPRRSHSATTAATVRSAMPARTPSTRSCRGIRSRPLGCRLSRRAQPVRGDDRRHPQPQLVPAGAVHGGGRGGELGRPHRLRLPRLRGRRRAGIVAAAGCRRRSRERCGERRSAQLGAFIGGGGRPDPAHRHDRHGGGEVGEALAEFRSGNYGASTCARRRYAGRVR